MSESINIMTDQIVVFTLDEQFYALPLRSVIRVIHAVEVRRLPKAPEIITGIINVKGQIIPVVDIRKRLDLATHEIDPDDRLIIADTGKRQVAILVDTVTGIRDLKPKQHTNTRETLPFAKHIKGVAKIDNELILIYDLEQFLSLDEEKELDQALKNKKQMNRNLTDNELTMVCEVIGSRMGLHFPVERWTMLRRNLVLAARDFGFYNMDRFINWFLSASLNSEEMQILAAHLTISETYFWREPQVFAALTDFILPELICSKKKKEKSIRIWSAGCSTGEEPFSIAIALHKTIPKIEEWNINILATDINPRVLSKAMKGTYGAWSFRNSPAWLKSNYFIHREDQKYELIPGIKKMVTFTCLSLAEMSAISNDSTMDIIFCRNVLMYFTPDWISKIANSFYRDLREDGWFVVSSCELSSQVFPQFTSVNFPGAILYRKGKNGFSHSLYPIAVTEKEIQPIQHNKFDYEKSNSLKVENNEFNPANIQPFNSSTFQQPQTIPEEKSTDKIFSIRLLADQGNLEKALSTCGEAIASNKLSPRLYFLRASILQELGKSTEAITSLKQAIYIDPDYIMGHFMLGNLFVRQGNPKSAKRFFENVLGLLHKYEDKDILPESEGLSAEYLREIIITNMDSIRKK